MSHCSVAPAASSGLDSQTTFLTLTLFSGRHVGVPRSYTNMAALYWAQWICAKYFDEFLRFRKTQKLKTWTSVTISWLYPLNGFRIFFYFVTIFFYCRSCKQVSVGIILDSAKPFNIQCILTSSSCSWLILRLFSTYHSVQWQEFCKYCLTGSKNL